MEKMEQAAKPAESAKPKSKTALYAVIGVVVIVIVAVVALYAAGYFGGGTAAQIAIEDDNVCSSGSTACKYTPISYSTSVGSKVTWKNTGGQSHTVTFTGSNVPSPADQPVSSGQSVSVTFSSAGTYQYYCTIHAWMKANVTIT